MNQKENVKPKAQKKKRESTLDELYPDDYADVQHTLREFDFNRKNFYCFSSDDFE